MIGAICLLNVTVSAGSAALKTKNREICPTADDKDRRRHKLGADCNDNFVFLKIQMPVHREYCAAC